MTTQLTRQRPSTLARRWGWPFSLFEEAFGPSMEDWGLSPWNGGEFVPAIDVSEDENSVTLRAEVPGLTRDDITVSVDHGILTVSGEKREEAHDEGEHYTRTERRYGHFERRMRLPENVDAEHIDAAYKDGVLTVTVPKTEESKPQRIEVK